MPVVTRIAPLALDILIVGGGVGGLAAAYMLSQSGHRVRVIEKHDLNALGGGIRVPPNLSKILRQWVGQDELMRVATRCVGSPFYTLHTGELVGYLPWKPAVIAETGGEFLLMHHGDLLRMLYQLAVGAGARVDFNTTASSIQPGSGEHLGPSITLANGEIIRPDLLVGADGSKSIVRDVIAPRTESVQRSGLTVYTGTVPGDAMLKDPELEKLLLRDEDVSTPCPTSSAVAMLNRNKKEYCYMLYSWPGDTIEQSPGGRWDEVSSIDKLRADGNCPIIDGLIRSTTKLIRTQFFEQRPDGIPEWVDSTGRIVLLGEAAHPVLPGANQSASLAVEDAVVLGSLLSHLRTMEYIPTFLGVYEELRQRRCRYASIADVIHGKSMALPAGPDAANRDRDLRIGMSEWDEGRIKTQFEEIAELFVYDAGDAAEEWWVSWGRLHESARENPRVTLDFSASSVSVRSD
ncbi:FAD/NAD-P-binding domain-containing protein [Daedaleopsis nitida]|nr:FAD/NAD-P-binding domain-containing protein [Daedaleopsis nitida]